MCANAKYSLRRKLPHEINLAERGRKRRRSHIRQKWPFDHRRDASTVDFANHHTHNADNDVCTHILNPSVWNLLPSELVERVLACLPMASLFRFRAVCRSWNTAPFRPVFKSLRALTMNPETWLIMLGAPRAEKSTPSSHWPFAFNLEDNKPVALPHTFLPFLPDPGCFSYCTAAGGLICYHLHMGFDINYEENPVSLWVGNPFTKEWKCLPPTIGSFPLNFPLRGLAGMVVLDSPKDNAPTAKQPVHYKIIVRTGSQARWGAGMMTEEYDSLTNAWRVTTMGNVPLDHRIEQVVHCNGSLYFLTWQARDGIYAYHMVKQEWTHILPPKRHQFTCPHMVECCGHLVLVSGVGRHHTTKVKGVRRLHVRTTGIKLWQLVEKDSAGTNVLADMERSATGASTWSSLSRMPEELVQEFVTGVQFHCTSIQNLIYLTNSINMFIFNVVARMWRRVIISQLPFLVQDFVSFVPKLEASP